MWRRRARRAAAACLLFAGCAYFNALYNANRLYDRGRKEIRSGNESSGRTALAESIRKAERALERHPDSRWADDALLLIVRARLLRGEFAGAAEAAERLLGMAQSEEDRARAAALLGRARVPRGERERADSLLSAALAGRLSQEDRVGALAGRAAARRGLGRLEDADADYVEALRLAPDDLPLRLARFQLLLEAGRGAEAEAEFRRLLGRSARPMAEDDLLAAADSFARRDPERARIALAGAGSHPQRGRVRAKLITLRGQLSLAAGDADSAESDFRRATEIAPGTDGAAAGHLALARLEIARAGSAADLERARAALGRATAAGSGREVVEARALSSGVDRVLRMIEAGDVAWLAAAEWARDSLASPYLARALFLRFADEWRSAVWAPKAILAALSLGPYHWGAPPGPDNEALRERLRSDYAENPYVAAVTGAADDGGESFATAELTLQQRMRVVLARAGATTGRPTPIVTDTLEEARRGRPPP